MTAKCATGENTVNQSVLNVSFLFFFSGYRTDCNNLLRHYLSILKCLTVKKKKQKKPKLCFFWQDLKSNNQRDDIAAARASLKENSSLLHSICSACLEHSDIASLAASKGSICNEIQNALDVISNASQGIRNQTVQPTSEAATLGSALDELEVSEYSAESLAAEFWCTCLSRKKSNWVQSDLLARKHV